MPYGEYYGVDEDWMNNYQTFHIDLKVSGARDKILLFHNIIGGLDSDWPWAKVAHGVHKARMCKVCGGAEYVNPRLGVKEIKALVRQVNSYQLIPGGLKVKIKSFRGADKCEAESKK